MTKYKKIKIYGKTIDEHRHIMQEHLGRKLHRNEVVHHINGDARDNRIENLEVQLLSCHSRLHMRGPNGSRTKLTTEDVIEIKRLFAPNVTTQSIAGKFNVARETIRDIRNGKTWQHVS
jgi:hypothetical protein